MSKTFRLPVELVHTLECLAQEKQVLMNQPVIQRRSCALDNLDRKG